MATVHVPILFHGQWTQENSEYRFTGTQIWGIKVPHSTAFEQFVKRAAQVISVDLYEFVKT